MLLKEIVRALKLALLKDIISFTFFQTFNVCEKNFIVYLFLWNMSFRYKTSSTIFRCNKIFTESTQKKV